MVGLRLKWLIDKDGFPQRTLSVLLNIDTVTYSKIENWQFALRKDFVPIIEEFYGLEKDSLAKIWLADKVYNVVKDKPAAKEALNAVEKIL
ncbi:MAG: hypothetical protein E7080_07725 [Bacteroidales bacterium]|nr:hypothetical protein [Bacteroidales bacterium]